MRMRSAAVAIAIGLLAGGAPALAASVAVSNGPGGTSVAGDQPCRVVTTHDGGAGSSGSSTSIAAGGGGVSGSTTVSPGGNGSSVSVGSASGSGGSAAGSNCVIYRHEK